MMTYNKSSSNPLFAFLFSLLLLLLLLQMVAEASGGESSSRRRKLGGGGGSSVFSLFNLKQKSRFWTESLIRYPGFDDLEATTTSNPAAAAARGGGGGDLLNYTNAGNIANYLKLMEVDSMYLPVPVNFIFLGFEGKGNQEFKLYAEELERWFTKIDHIFEHTRVSSTGEVVLLTPFYKTNIDKEQDHNLPSVSHVNYKNASLCKMGEKVTAVFERAIDVLARKDDVSDDNRDDGAGLWQVDVDIMDVFFTSLVEYLELDKVYNVFVLNPKRDTKRAKYGYRRGLSESEINYLNENKDLQARILQSGSAPESVIGALDKMKRPLYEKHPMAKFAWTITDEADTIEWYNICQDVLNNVENLYKGKNTSDKIQSKVTQLVKGKNDDMKIIFDKVVKSGDFSGVHVECLTDTWIGKDRWAFIDLSAGPFSWGPAVGGEGVRTELSLPNVEKTIGAVAELSEDEAEDRLQEAIQDKFAAFGDNDHQAIDILLAEIDLYELFAFKHCTGRKVKLALCEELDERMRDLKNELHSFEGEEYDETHKKKAEDALKRMENWNLFSDNVEDFQNYTVARDAFLSDLGATLWGSMRHIIAPSLATGAFHHYEKISFQLLFITQEKVKHIKQLPVNLNALMDGLSSLVLPSQKALFSQHMLPLSEDPALAMAFSVARRAAAVPLLLVNGTYRKTVRSYLDSSILQHQLQRVNSHGSLKGAHAHSRSTLEVPIFWFIDGDTLLIDKHYQAKALSDMVVIAQSEPSSWESHLQCNGNPLLWDLRRPIKAALAAVAEHIAGLIPLHLVYSHAHETAIEDWVWSVGCNPASATSPGWQISKFQSDTIARSYILTALEESIQLTNSAINILLTESTSKQTYKAFQSREVELTNKYKYIVSLWRRISTVTGELRYEDATRLLTNLEDITKGFAEYVNETISQLHPIHCEKERRVDVEFDMTTIPAFLVVLFVLWMVLKPRRPKPKIN